jgi:DNA primase
VLPSSRADHAARLLLGDAAAWEGLSQEVHVMLCELPPPHGPLFAWLDSQIHEHGPLPWGSLSESLEGHASAALAFKLMAQARALGGSSEDSAAELPGLLTRMLIDHLKAQETEAIAAQALDRYRSLQTRRRTLESSLASQAAPS